jgi:hypothetical protein
MHGGCGYPRTRTRTGSLIEGSTQPIATIAHRAGIALHGISLGNVSCGEALVPITVRFHAGVVGNGDTPLVWKDDDHYELLEGGNVKIRRLT